MDQIVVSVCCPPPNEHIEIKNVANNHIGVTLKRRQKRPKIHVLLRRRRSRRRIFFCFFV